jgi:hypothetical protein
MKHRLGKHRLGKYRTRKVYKGGATIQDLIDQILNLQDFRNKKITKIDFFKALRFFQKSLPPHNTPELTKLINQLTGSEIKVVDLQKRFENRDMYLEQIMNELLIIITKTPQSKAPARKAPASKTPAIKTRKSPSKCSPKTAGHNWQLCDAGGGGNCFYYSVYEALHADELLGKLQSALDPLPLDTLNKTNFNLTMRTIVGDYLNTPAGSTIFNNFYKLMTDALTENYNDVNFYRDHEEYLKWLIDLYYESDTFIDFKQAVISEIKKEGVYVQSLEIEIVKFLLKQAGIHLFVDQSNNQKIYLKTRKLSGEGNRMLPAIYIFNDPYGQGHFKWLKVDAAAE